jgi:hypothetical protein
MSDVWDTRDKWVATLLPPGGLFTVFYFSFVVTVGGDGPTGAQQTAGIVLAVFLLVTPFVTTAYLAWRLRQLR